jgi:hypothetical protein
MGEQSPVERLQAIEKQIEKAKLETGVYERQLKELLPLRKEMEAEALEKHQRPIQELSAYKEELEEELDKLVGELEENIKLAQEENKDG